MTAQEMINEVTYALGNRTDLTDARYLIWLNWALYDVCAMQRKRAFPALRFHILEEDATFATSIVEGTAAAGAATTVTLAAGDDEINDYYNDWVIKIDTEVKLIVDYVNSTNVATIAGTWDTTPTAASTYEIYKRIWSLKTDFSLDPATAIWAIQRIEEADNGNALIQKDWEDLAGRDYKGIGDPGDYSHRGDNILFGTTPDTATYYRIFYYRYPTQLTATALTTECELPELWHEAVVLGAIFRGFNQLLEDDSGSHYLKLYKEALTNKQSTGSLEDKHHVNRGIRLRRYE